MKEHILLTLSIIVLFFCRAIAQKVASIDQNTQGWRQASEKMMVKDSDENILMEVNGYNESSPN